jgi:ATP-binding cassette subfamily B protein
MENCMNLPEKLSDFIWLYLKDNKKYLFGGFTIVAFLAAIETSLNPYLLKVMINTVIQYSYDLHKMLAAILLPAALYMLLPMLETSEIILSNYIYLKLFPAMKAAIATDTFTYLLHHSHAFFENTHIGSLTKKIGDLVERQVELVNNLVDLGIRLSILICCNDYIN